MKNIVSNGKYKSEYGFHTHEDYEIIYYSSGKGETNVNGKEIKVEMGDISIIPPNFSHSSKSIDNLSYIRVTGEIGNLLQIQEPIIIKDIDKDEAQSIMSLIFLNRYGNEEYLNALCSVLAHFLLKNLKIEGQIEKAVAKIKREIILNFHDCNFNVCKTLNESGYSEDYVRYYFKKLTTKTPIEFLTEIRIQHAINLIKIYNSTLPLSEIALSCGYLDYIYFSRKFKQVTGVSPASFCKNVEKEQKKKDGK